ncbi:MAG: hypothetical protein KA354_09800 [Phycisphaerae bacterium]|nr:hypothetical protein [Phycisphaerae bacterium]
MDQPISPAGMRASRALLGAVVLLSASGLMFELTLTRIFSATIWYHYTFVAISVALFGWGLGGFLVYILRLGRHGDTVRQILVALSLLLSLTLALFPCGILKFPLSPERLNYYLLLSVLPFLTGGAALSLAFESHGKDSNRLYFADLVGAALGTLAVPAAISLLGAETAVMAIAVLPALGAVLLSSSIATRSRGPWTALAGLAVLGTAAFSVWNFKTQTFTISNAPEKALYKLLAAHPGAQITSDKWNVYSRITSVQGFDEFHLARLFIDSDAETSVLRWDGSSDQPEDARSWFRAFPFRLANEPEVLVIGPGGGTDVVMAIAAGSPRVTAVEMNPLMIDCVRRLGDKAGNLYDHPKVNLVLDEGRNFIQRTDQKFDFIVLGFVDSWASVASGGLSLTESYLYTRDALEAYYDRLTDSGALVIIRWPTDIPRLVSNSVSLLSKRGMPMEEIGKHILAASIRKSEGAEPVETVFMLTRSPLSPEKVDRLLAGHEKAHIYHATSRVSEPVYADLFSGRIDFDRYTDSFDTLATPVPDDHPFYFATDKPYGIASFVTRLFTPFVVAVLVVTAVILGGGRVLGFQAPGGRAVAYFGALGIGFIICEVSLLQRLILLLGHPIYTLVVLLFTLLVAGGLGSLFARRLDPTRIGKALGWIIPAIVLLIALAAFGLPTLVRAALPLDLNTRIAVAAASVFPFGFLMGMPFPLGLRRSAQEENGPAVSALWGINGVASVVGSIGGTMLAVAAGFTWVFLAAAACYAIAWTARPR